MLFSGRYFYLIISPPLVGGDEEEGVIFFWAVFLQLGRVISSYQTADGR
jgi:hypothetical protein